MSLIKLAGGEDLSEMPLFPQTGDPSDSLGTYAGTINTDPKRKREKLQALPEKPEQVMFTPDSVMYFNP